ncbi:hypothetical protein NDU88_000867 [Pleurodeles waltl]|uniref:Uncharacterized protein n=1 Tax=Pleurodeles waltl TaxID=8319 RepID=A0AAV7L851_PLEWA|nr:hypothetical protein NDU88_000867 [Pleurodeles waltl]
MVPGDEVPETFAGSLLHQFQCFALVDMPVLPWIQEVLKWEWKDPDKILMPRFMANLYPLKNKSQDLPDSFVASLVGRSSLAEDAIIRDAVDRQVDAALKMVYSGAHLALCTQIYGTFVAQSLISDLKGLYRAPDESSDCSRVLEHIERQVECLSDVSFDVVRASALSGGACVVPWHSLVGNDWKMDAAQRSFTLRMPF